MDERLSSVAPDLAERLASAPADQLAALSRRVAEWAASTVGMRGPPRSAALALLAEGRVGASPERAALEGYVAELAARAWDLQERVARGQADEAEYLGTFSRARAASAVWYALGDDPRAGALEAVYEAYAATGALDDLRAVVSGASSE
jgi:hypothetical protein